MQHDSQKPAIDRGDDDYEAPGIEAIMTPEELEREVLYGGDGQSIIVCPTL